jgi:uncharacterized membrane protein YcgQ (UPF0703/DUF1980 family)
MKKTLLALCVLICLLLSACGGEGSGSGTVEIMEKKFIAQCTDIQNNPGSYEGKTIIIEGLADVRYNKNESKIISSTIYRNSPGCCGNDGKVSFTLEYDGDAKPKTNDWIAVEGIIKVNTLKNGNKRVVISVTNLTVKDERGAEFVQN